MESRKVVTAYRGEKMLKTVLLVILMFEAGYACKTEWQYGKSAEGCVVVDGVEREFRYYLPEHAKGVVLPMILVLHGGGGDPKRMEKYSRFTQMSERSGSFIVVYPRAVKKHWNDGRNGLKGGVDDVAFISRLIDVVPRVEKGEVYVAGMSNGGLMVQRLACEIPQKLGGAAVVSAAMSRYLYGHCREREPLKTVLFFGDDDRAFLDNGLLVNPLRPSQVRGEHVGIEKTLEYWAERNKCHGSKVIRTMDRVANDDTKIVVQDYIGCSRPLRFFHIENGGHRWADPAARNGSFIVKKLGTASHEISTAAEIVRYFHLIKI